MSTPPPHPWMASCSVLHSVTWCLHVLNFSFFCFCFPRKRENFFGYKFISFHLLRTSIPVGASDEIISLRLIYFRPSRDNYHVLKFISFFFFVFVEVNELEVQLKLNVTKRFEIVTDWKEKSQFMNEFVLEKFLRESIKLSLKFPARKFHANVFCWKVWK